MPEPVAAPDRKGRSQGHSACQGRHRSVLNTAPASARRRGLRVLQRDALDQHDAALGVQRSFAETVDAYIERKLAEE